MSEFNGYNENSNKPYFYNESYAKPKSVKNRIILMMVIVALVSSIIGGGVVFTAFQFIAPALQPSVNSYFGNTLPGKEQGLKDGESNADILKQIVIEKSDSVVSEIAEKASPSIVGIRVTARVNNFFLGETQGTGEGSGIIIDKEGYILTNYHVIQNALDSRTNRLSNAAKIEVFLSTKESKPYNAEVIGTDWRTDLAVIKINASDIPAADIGNSDNLRVGELAVAIGNPGGLEYMGSVTAGVISGLNRTIETETGVHKLIQTDAAINPGNSGGALLNSEGKVIGVNSIKIAAQGYEGLGFAIPINDAMEIAESLIEFTYVKGRPLFGIRADDTFSEDVAKYYNVPAGVRVMEVMPFTGAEKAGIKAYDIITEIDGVEVKSLDEMNEVKNKKEPGEKVTVKLYREGEYLTYEVELTEDKG
jgi:serine protease Do